MAESSDPPSSKISAAKLTADSFVEQQPMFVTDLVCAVIPKIILFVWKPVPSADILPSGIKTSHIVLENKVDIVTQGSYAQQKKF